MAESTMAAQSEITLVHENILQTSISISTAVYGTGTLTLGIMNSGTTNFKMSDSNLQLFLIDSSSVLHSDQSFTPTISAEKINIGFWDPSEILTVTVSGLSGTPKWVKFVTPNGITAETSTFTT